MSIRLLIAFLVSSSLAVTLVAQDKVFPIKGSVAIGTLQSLQRDEVTIEVRTKNQIYKTNEIAKVVFDDEPNNLDRARDFINNRQFNQAQDELNKIDVAQVKDERVLNDIQFYKGYAAAKLSLSGIGSPADAGKLLAVALKADPQSYHFYKSQELLGDLALVLNSLEPAGRYFRELQAAPFPELKALAMYKLGEVDLNGGKFAEARKQFQTVATATASDAETTRLKNLAEVGLAVCDAREGKSKEALDKLQELVKKLDSADQVLFARIYNSQGTCYLALGQNQSALLAYLKTDLLFAGSAEAHAEALYQLSQLWPKVGQPQRATEARKRLTTLYPSSVWSSKP